jgi:hypothetical protein
VRSQQSLVGQYVEKRAEEEENYRLEEHKMRSEVSQIEKETAEIAKRNLVEKHQLEMQILSMEGERKKRLLDLEIETARYKRDLAKRQFLQN